jgi:hypothetical protein
MGFETDPPSWIKVGQAGEIIRELVLLAGLLIARNISS